MKNYIEVIKFKSKLQKNGENINNHYNKDQVEVLRNSKVDFSYETFCEYVRNKMSMIFQSNEGKYEILEDTQPLQEFGLMTEEETLRHIYDNNLFDKMEEIISKHSFLYSYDFKELKEDHGKILENNVGFSYEKFCEYVRNKMSEIILTVEADEDVYIIIHNPYPLLEIVPLEIINVYEVLKHIYSNNLFEELEKKITPTYKINSLINSEENGNGLEDEDDYELEP